MKSLEEKSSQQEAQIKELDEQLRDVFIHLEARSKCEGASDQMGNDMQGIFLLHFFFGFSHFVKKAYVIS